MMKATTTKGYLKNPLGKVTTEAAIIAARFPEQHEPVQLRFCNAQGGRFVVEMNNETALELADLLRKYVMYANVEKLCGGRR